MALIVTKVYCLIWALFIPKRWKSISRKTSAWSIWE